MSHSFPFSKVYGFPIAISAITIYGLLSALLGDGIWDKLSWVALAIPLAVIVREYVRGEQPIPHRGQDVRR